MFFPALFSVGLEASEYATPFTNWMSSKPPPQGVGFGSEYWVGALVEGLMTKRRGCPSSLHITHIMCVVAFHRMPSEWQPVPLAVPPPMVHIFKGLPLVVYSPTVLDLLSVPSLAVMFCQPIHTCVPSKTTLSGWFVLVVAPTNRHTWYPGSATTFDTREATLQALPPLDEPADDLLPLLLLLVQAATPSPSTAAITTDLVTLPTVLTRAYPLLV